MYVTNNIYGEGGVETIAQYSLKKAFDYWRVLFSTNHRNAFIHKLNFDTSALPDLYYTQKINNCTNWWSTTSQKIIHSELQSDKNIILIIIRILFITMVEGGGLLSTFSWRWVPNPYTKPVSASAEEEVQQ